ncbi:MAG TPA: DUF4215 domain-containing protein [Polyangiaceae bacterium]|nr:DUF4215 domain-containing protein [Polyangiaceae bacterium]
MKDSLLLGAKVQWGPAQLAALRAATFVTTAFAGIIAATAGCGTSATLSPPVSDGAPADTTEGGALPSPEASADATATEAAGGDAAARDSGEGGTTGGDAASDGAAPADASGGDADATTFVPPEAGPTCGDGVLDPGEQCDDGNRFDLDGCDSTCRYENVERVTVFSIQGTTAPSGCTPTTNRFGTQSLTSTALAQLNPSIQAGVDQGSTNIFLQFLGLVDPSGGVNMTGFALGLLSGQPDPAKGAWPDGGVVDWAFLADPGTVGTNGLPRSQFGGASLTSGSVTAGPSDLNLPLPIGGVPAVLGVRNARLTGALNAAPVPDVPSPPPEHLASGVTVFQAMTADQAGQGICGNLTVASLAAVPVPQSLTTGSTACSGSCSGSRSYTSCGSSTTVGDGCNSWLDVLVGGCAVSALCIPAVNAQQPDVAEATTVRTLSLGAGNKVPASQSAGNQDAYSAYLKFDTLRAHISGETCAATSDCQTGKSCVGNVCQ